MNELSTFENFASQNFGPFTSTIDQFFKSLENSKNEELATAIQIPVRKEYPKVNLGYKGIFGCIEGGSIEMSVTVAVNIKKRSNS